MSLRGIGYRSFSYIIGLALAAKFFFFFFDILFLLSYVLLSPKLYA